MVKVSGVKLALDGDLIRYDSEEPGRTELAVRRLAGQLGMSDSEIHSQLKRATAWRLRRPTLYQQVFRLAEKRAGKTLPREMLPGIQLESPKITRNLTTAWFAKRVDERRANCSGAALTALTPAHNERQQPDERAADQERDQAKEGANGETDVDLRTGWRPVFASSVQIPPGRGSAC